MIVDFLPAVAGLVLGAVLPFGLRRYGMFVQSLGMVAALLLATLLTIDALHALAQMNTSANAANINFALRLGLLLGGLVFCGIYLLIAPVIGVVDVVKRKQPASTP